MSLLCIPSKKYGVVHTKIQQAGSKNKITLGETKL